MAERKEGCQWGVGRGGWCGVVTMLRWQGSCEGGGFAASMPKRCGAFTCQ